MFKQVFHRLRRLAVAGFAALGLLVSLMTLTPLVRWWGRALAGPWNDPAGDVLIVLAGGVIDADMLAPNSYWRCVYADHAWHTGRFRRVVVTGKAAAPLMRDFLVCHGMPSGAILVDEASNSTRETALNVKRLLDGVGGPKVLLTSDYHMYRAHRAFTKAGLQVLPRPFPDVGKRAGAWMSRWDAFADLAIETTKIAYYYVRGWI